MNIGPVKPIKFEESLLEILEVVVHNILYYRKLYPDGIFKLMKKYGVPVHISQYPDLNLYVKECLSTVGVLIKSKQCKQVDICFYSNKTEIIEKFVFRISKCTSKKSSVKVDPFLNNKIFSLRSLLLKLSTCDSNLKPLPEGSTFQIQVHATENAMNGLNKAGEFENFPWITNENTHTNDFKVVPIHNVTHALTNLEVFVEENLNKS